MKTMTCRQLGGPCDLAHHGSTANDVIKAQDAHLKKRSRAVMKRIGARSRRCRVGGSTPWREWVGTGKPSVTSLLFPKTDECRPPLPRSASQRRRGSADPRPRPRADARRALVGMTSARCSRGHGRDAATPVRVITAGPPYNESRRRKEPPRRCTGCARPGKRAPRSPA